MRNRFCRLDLPTSVRNESGEIYSSRYYQCFLAFFVATSLLPLLQFYVFRDSTCWHQSSTPTCWQSFSLIWLVSSPSRMYIPKPDGFENYNVTIEAIMHFRPKQSMYKLSITFNQPLGQALPRLPRCSSRCMLPLFSTLHYSESFSITSKKINHLGALPLYVQPSSVRNLPYPKKKRYLK